MAKVILEIDGVRYKRMAASNTDCRKCAIKVFCHEYCNHAPCNMLGFTKAIFERESKDETEQRIDITKYIEANKLKAEIDKVIDRLKGNCDPNPLGTLEECLAAAEIETLGLVKDIIDEMGRAKRKKSSKGGANV